MKEGQFRRANSAGSSFGEQVNDYNVTGIAYDKNGNIMALDRRGVINSSNGIGDMDKLIYGYDAGNKLIDVTDSGNVSYGFVGSNSGNDYAYDANGNMVSDANKGISAISYNHLNLPDGISINGSGGNGTISYIYDATGNKLEKKVTEGSTTKRTLYAGSYVYEKVNTNADALKFFSHPEGYVDAENGFGYVYQYKDHLGNIRLSYKNIGTVSSPNLEILEENNYYPFGLQHKGYNDVVSANTNSVASKFKFNSIEYEESLGIDWYEMPLRQYDPTIARWTTIDPVTHYSQSTYVGYDNNPVFWADPSGADVETIEGGWKFTGQDAIDVFNILRNNSSDSKSESNDEEETISNSISLPNNRNVEFARSSGCQQGNCYNPIDFKNDSAETIYKKLVNNFASFVSEKNESIRSGTSMMNVYIEELIRLDNIYGETQQTSGEIINKTINYNGGTIEIVALPVKNDPIVGYRFKGAVKRMQGSGVYYSFEVHLTGEYRNKVKGWNNTGFTPKMLNLRFSSAEQYDSFVKEVKKAMGQQ